jgi:hypothetical protein
MEIVHDISAAQNKYSLLAQRRQALGDVVMPDSFPDFINA